MEAILVIAAIVALVWGAIFITRMPLLIGCLVFLVASCCLGKYFFVGPLGLSADRLVLVLLVAAFVLRRGMRLHEPKPLQRADLFLGAFITWLVIRTFTTDWNHKLPDPDHVTPLWHLIVGYLTPLIVYWIARQARINEQQVDRLHLGLACFGLYLVAVGLFEAMGAWSLVFPRYIADPEIGVHFGRVRGPMVQAARFGMFLIICLAASWLVFMHWKRFGRAGQLVVLALLPLYLMVVFFTYTRSVWIGTGLAAMVILSLTLPARFRNAVVVCLIVGGLFGAYLKRDSLVAFKREKAAEVTRESTYMRASFAYVSWQMFKDRPIFGWGFNQFPVENGAYLSDRSTNLNLESIRGYIHHNTFLSILVDTGIVGLLLFLAVLLGLARSAWQLWSDSRAPTWARRHALLMLAALGPYTLQLLFREVSYSPIENGIICLLAGVTIGIRAKLAASSSSQQTTPAAPVVWRPLATS